MFGRPAACRNRKNQPPRLGKNEHDLPRDSFGWLGHTALAAFAVDVPKAVHSFFQWAGPTFLGSTLKRLSSETGFGEPILLCNNDHRFLVKEELESAKIASSRSILEPVARNTAAAIAVAALAVARENPNGMLVVMPSDHVISDEARFVEAVRRAAKVAQTGRFVLFGIKPAEAQRATVISARAPHSRDSTVAHSRSTPSSKSLTPRRPAVYVSRQLLSGTAASSCSMPARSSKSLQRLEPRILEAARARSCQAEDDLGFHAPGRAPPLRSRRTFPSTMP